MATEYISRDSVYLNKHVFYHPKNGIARNNGYDPADWAIRISDVMDVPPADVRPVVRGHWVWNPNGMDWGLGAWCCDQCRIKAETWWANDRRNNPLRCSGGRFCGNCGADMRPAPEPPKREDCEV